MTTLQGTQGDLIRFIALGVNIGITVPQVFRADILFALQPTSRLAHGTVHFVKQSDHTTNKYLADGHLNVLSQTM